MPREGSSATARLIAAATVLAEHDARLRGILPPDAARWCERFLGATRSGRRLLTSVRLWPGRAAWRVVERLTLPGVVRHWLLRKRKIERLARDALEEGFTQLVVLGAGLDTLAFRLEGDFGRVIEVDHPGSQAEVRGAIAGDATDVRLVGADLSRPLPELDLDRAPTLFIAEGLLMYLPPERVRELLTEMSALPVPDARLVATFMDVPTGGAIKFPAGSRLIDGWLKRGGEPMRWSIRGDRLPAFLADAGWSHRQTIKAVELAREFDSSARPFAGEDLFVADRGS